MPKNSIVSSAPERHAEVQVAQLFKAHGWKVQREPIAGAYRADLLVKKGRNAFLIEIKAPSEGRPDRVIPLLSQAILQAQAYERAHGMARPLAVIYVRDASATLVGQIKRFSTNFAPNVAVGIVGENGLRWFLGEGLEELNVEAPPVLRPPAKSLRRASDIFSDLNQWMLKVLLAPEIPERLLAAPRAEYRNVSDLANAAKVSVMSAFRFVQQLREEGFLDESYPRFKLVRRAAFFHRWRSAALRSSHEMPMRFLIRGDLHQQVRDAVAHHQACLGLFAASDALHLGHVKGVPPYVYVPRLPRSDRDVWRELVRPSSEERPDLILRQAAAPESVFRAAVHQDGVAVSDVLQIWLDVSGHPSRGEEQAKLIQRKVLGHVIEEAA